jgi:hypothetical protein
VRSCAWSCSAATWRQDHARLAPHTALFIGGKIRQACEKVELFACENGLGSQVDILMQDAQAAVRQPEEEKKTLLATSLSLLAPRRRTQRGRLGR